MTSDAPWTHQILEPFPFLYDKFLGFDTYSVASEVEPLFGCVIAVVGFLVLRALHRMLWGATGNLLLARFSCCRCLCRGWCCCFPCHDRGRGKGNVALRTSSSSTTTAGVTADATTGTAQRANEDPGQQHTQAQQQDVPKSSVEAVVDSGYWGAVLEEQRRRFSVHGSRKPPTLGHVLEWDRLRPDAKMLHSLRSYNILHNPRYSDAFGVSAEHQDMDLDDMRVSDLEDADLNCDLEAGGARPSASGSDHRSSCDSIAQASARVERQRQSRLAEIEESSWYHRMFEEEIQLSPDRQQQLRQQQQAVRAHRRSAPAVAISAAAPANPTRTASHAGRLTWTDGPTTTAAAAPAAPSTAPLALAPPPAVPPAVVTVGAPAEEASMYRALLQQQLSQFYLQRGDEARASTAPALLEQYGYQLGAVRNALLQKYGEAPAGW